MPEPIPLELCEAIIDDVGLKRTRGAIQDLLSLCLASKTFVSRSQRHLYRDVTIHLANDRFYNVPNSPYSAPLRRTVALLTTLRTRPHLRFHIKNLRCKLIVPVASGVGEATIIDAVKAIAQMPNIRKFTLGFDAGTNSASINFQVIASRVLRGAIASLLQRPRLTHYTVHNISFYPQSLLLLSKRVRHLRVLHTTLDPEDYDETQDALIEVEKLDIAMYDADISPNHRILVLLKRVREIHLTIEFRGISPLQTEAGFPLMGYLCDHALNALNYLTVHFVFTLAGPTVLVYDPYLWRWDAILPSLQSLKALRLRVTFQGCLKVGGASFGNQWCDMKTALLSHSLSPELRRVDVEVRIRADDTDPGMQRHNLREARAFLAGVRKAPYLQQSPSVTRLRREGRRTELVFSSEVTLGSHVRTQID